MPRHASSAPLTHSQSASPLWTGPTQTCGRYDSGAITAVAYVSNREVPPLDGPPRAISSAFLPWYGCCVRSVATTAEGGIMPRSAIISTLLANMRAARASMALAATDETSLVNHRGDGTLRAPPSPPPDALACLASDAIAGVTKRDDSHMAISTPSTANRSYLALKCFEMGSLASPSRLCKCTYALPESSSSVAPAGIFDCITCPPGRRIYKTMSKIIG